MATPWTPKRVLEERGRLVAAIRLIGGDYDRFTRAFATSLGLHATDAAALAEILTAEDGGPPLSPARLAERIGLTSGATTAVINRLEKLGHVERSREHTDRRVVTLRSSPAIQGPAWAFFATLGVHLDAMLVRYSAADLERFAAFVADLHETVDAALADSVPPND